MTHAKTWAGAERRAKAAKARKLNERRRDMLILSSATQADIYLWGLSLTIMGLLLGGFSAVAFMGLK